jgi:sugar phosphate isomerase/epimerase
MRLSCLPVSLYPDLSCGRRSLPDWLQFAASIGLDGADVSVAHVTSRAIADLDALRRAAADSGIAVAMLASYSDFVHPDRVARRRQLDDVRRWIDAAARIGAAAIRLTAGEMRDGLCEADALGCIADGLVEAAEAAHACGVRALYENHVRGAGWTRNDFTQRAARFLDVVRRTDGSHLEVLFDTANNLALDEDPTAVLDKVIARVGAVHVSDLTRRGAFEPTVVGTGVAPNRELLSRLVAYGFDGWVSIEEASRTGEDGFRQAIRFTDDTWLAVGGRARGRA